MKTPLQKIFVRKFADLNDQLCFYMFNKEELNNKLRQFSNEELEKYTTDLFPENKYSEKIHITLKKIPKFQEENQTLNLSVYFSFTYEYLSSYIESIMDLLSKINNISLTRTERNNNTLENQLKLLISKAGSGTPPDELFLTIQYARLRRNYYTHILENLSTSFNDLIDNESNNLNNFWQKSLKNFDFTKKDLENFKIEECIDLIKILKIILQDIDAFVSSILNKTELAKYLTIENFAIKPSKVNKFIIEERIRKIQKICKSNFDINLLENDIEHFAKTIGVK